MINFLQSFFFFSLAATPCAAGLAFLIALTSRELRPGILFGFFSGIAGFAIGVSLAGGFGQTEGWGWGNVGAVLYGCCYAATGFLIGGGAYSITVSQALAVFVILAGLQFPLAHAAYTQLRPALIRSEMAWWKPILANGYTESSETAARAHLSEPTRLALENGGGQKNIPVSTLNVLYDIGVFISDYTPLPAEVAQKMFERNPKDGNLARNPSTPRSILVAMENSKDAYLLSMLASNPNTPAEVLSDLGRNSDENILEMLAANTRLSSDMARTLYVSHPANGPLKCRLARNPNTPVDILVEMSKKEDVDVLYQLSLNKALPTSQYPLIESRCETIVQEEKSKPNFREYGVRYNHARLLKEALEKRTQTQP